MYESSLTENSTVDFGFEGRCKVMELFPTMQGNVQKKCMCKMIIAEMRNGQRGF